MLVQGHQTPLMFSGVFRAEKFDGVTRGQEITMMVGVPTLLEAFMKWSLRSSCFNDEAFFW